MVHHVLRGVKFAFPNASSRLLPDYPALRNVYDEFVLFPPSHPPSSISFSLAYQLTSRVMALANRVDKLPGLKEYFSSNRREPFKDGLFRHYPELDVEADLEN